MNRFVLTAAVLMTGALVQGAMAEEAKQTAADEGMKVTGMVTEVDDETKEITINDQTFVMPDESGGASMMPQVGAEVTLFYEEKDGQRTITRIGQAQ
jgi:Cu/Ag efflux protein CusF